jgi:RNA polymerase sigma-70 factor (ECF subfamily)
MDRTLVEQAQRGDETAFESLVLGIGDRLYSTAVHILRDTSAAEDATQVALIDMWRHLPRLRDAGAFEPWAYRILVRAAYAEGSRLRGVVANLVLLVPEAFEDGPAGSVADVHALHDQLERGFQRLTRQQRAVVTLKHYADLSDAEIAASLDLPIGTVKSRLHYAMRALRAALEADDRAGRQRGIA